MPIKLTQKQIIILGGSALVIIIVVLAFMFGGSTTPQAGQYQLTIWGTQDESVWKQIISDYQTLRPNVTVKYQSINPNSYDTTLLNALAAGNGPDIFEINNRQLLENLSRITPVSSQQFNIGQLNNLFPDVVNSDFTFNNKIYALPLNMDTLALFYNGDLFNAAGVAHAPITWGIIEALVPVLKKSNSNGQINQAAIALGGSSLTVNYAPDILSLLMLQYGANMAQIGQNGYSASFAEAQSDQNSGLNAFNFYLGFSTPSNANYTWNDSLNNSFDSFAAGNTAMILAYNKDISAIQNKNPFLNLKIAAAPQLNLNQPINYASYQGLAVSTQSKAPSWAWDFILFLTTSDTEETSYLKATNQLPALRDLISQGINDPLAGVFNRQALTAKSWAEPDETQANAILSNAIKNVLNGITDSATALSQAETQINQLGQSLQLPTQ
jgi:multiple sugar transport system substrate-binding protein